jgi:hypothetical protein
MVVVVAGLCCFLCSQMSENEVVELSAPSTSVDNQRLQVLTRSAEGKMLSASFTDVSSCWVVLL